MFLETLDIPKCTFNQISKYEFRNMARIYCNNINVACNAIQMKCHS